MRCNCCDRNLNDYESTIKYRSTGEHADVCNKCRKEIGDDLFYGRGDLEPFDISGDIIDLPADEETEDDEEVRED